MVKTLLIIPTKNRIGAINCLLTNLQTQDYDFDIYIADMSTEYNITDDVLFRRLLEFLKIHRNHKYMVEKVLGNNQLAGQNAGLSFAQREGYDLCFYGDDDLIYEPGYFKMGIEYMKEHPECGVLSGMTLIPSMDIPTQTAPEWFWNHDDYQGKLDLCYYFHCTLIHPTNEPIEYEQLFGGFFFRTEDAIKVGGFPDYLSPAGNRGENILHTAIYYLGKKLILNPKMISWHYSVPYGGLRIPDEIKNEYVKEDWKLFYYIRDRKKPSTRL